MVCCNFSINAVAKNQTFKNDLVDRSDEAISEQELQLRSIWQGRMSLKITFEELETVDVQEIRELLDDTKRVSRALCLIRFCYFYKGRFARL
jgi:hypothetical protein